MSTTTTVVIVKLIFNLITALIRACLKKFIGNCTNTSKNMFGLSMISTPIKERDNTSGQTDIELESDFDKLLMSNCQKYVGYHGPDYVNYKTL